MNASVFRNAIAADWEAIRALLLASKLPLEGAQAHLGNFLVVENDEGLIACGGLELYGSAALLRSVAVAEAHRGQGLGMSLVDQLCAQARKARIETLVLLTDSAELYFQRFGFKTASRKVLPDAVKASAEFRGACPDTATAMAMALASPTP